MSLSDNEEAPRGQKKGGGLGAFFKSTSTTEDTPGMSSQNNHADWDETSRGGYSTVSKMFRAKVRRSHKQKHGEDEQKQKHEHNETSSNYLGKLDGLLHRQHERARTARREGIDTDEQSVQSRGAHSSVGRLQRTSNHSTTTTTTTTTTPTKSQTTSLSSSSSHRPNSKHHATTMATVPSRRSLTASLSNASGASVGTSSSTSTHRHSNHKVHCSSASNSASSSNNNNNNSNSAKEHTQIRCRTESRPRINTSGDLHLSSHRSSTRGSGAHKSPSVRKSVSSQNGSSHNSTTRRRRRSKSSDDLTTDEKRRGSTESTPGKPLPTVKAKQNSRDGSAEAPGSDPVFLGSSPVKVSPEACTARKAIQFLPSTNAKPLLFPSAETIQHVVEGKSNRSQNAAPKQYHASSTSNLSNKSSSKHGSGASSSSRHSRTLNSSTHSYRSGDADRDSATNSRGLRQDGSNSSSARLSVAPEHKHPYGDSSMQSYSRRPSINADHSRSASTFTSEIDDSGSDSNLSEHAKESGFGVTNDSWKPDPINSCFSSLSSESFPGEDCAAESVVGRSSDKIISQQRQQPSHGKISDLGEASVGIEHSSCRPRSLDGETVHGEASVAGRESIPRHHLPGSAKSASESRHVIHSSSNSRHTLGAEASGGVHNNTNKLTGTAERARCVNYHDKSESHHSQSRQITSSPLKAEHLSSKSDSVERQMATNGNISSLMTTTTTTTTTATMTSTNSKGINTKCNADNGMISCEAEGLKCLDKNSKSCDDHDNDDDDGATFAEPSEVTNKLKTSHLRRLVEPPRRVVRCASHSSYNSAVGSLSSRDDSVQFRGVQKAMRTESELNACVWRPPHRRKSSDHINVYVEDERFETEMNHQSKKTDSAPKTPRRRSSTAGSRRSSVSSYASSYTRTSRRNSQDSLVYQDGQDDLDGSESMIEEEEEESSSNPTDYGPADDVFSCFSWSTAKQDADAFQRERSKIRDSIRDTPFYQVYKSSGFSRCGIAS